MAKRGRPTKPKLTYKQQKFVEAYSGNATEAARIAGYKGNYHQLAVIGNQNLNKLYIKEVIEARDQSTRNKRIADREEIQEFWTDEMRAAKGKEKIRASELLCRSQGGFIDNVKVEADLTINVIQWREK